LRIEPEFSGVAIVLRGNFNPTIFQPAWFSKHELITEEAAAGANIVVIHPEITTFNVDPDFSFSCDRDRLNIVRAVAPLILASDLISRIFGDLLPHTPIGQLGINRYVHFSVGSFEERDRVGRMLAPREPWGRWGEELASEDEARAGGLLSLTMIQQNVSDREAGWVQVKVEPSTRIGRGRTGIFIEVNDHYQLPEPEKAVNASTMIQILQERFDTSLRNSDAIVDQIMSLKS
jgi:hypothetical protein